MKSLLLFIFLTASVSHVRAQNLVINPALESYTGSGQACFRWLGENNEIVNELKDHPGWMYKFAAGIHCEECESAPCDGYNFKVHKYTTNSTVLNPSAYCIKGASAYYGSTAFELVNTGVKSIEEYKNDSLKPSTTVIGSSQQLLVKGKTYFFSVWLSTRYEEAVVKYPSATWAWESLVTADFGLDLWTAETLKDFENGSRTEKQLYFNDLELEAVNPAQNIINGNADSNWVELRFVFTAQEDAEYFVFGNFPMAIDRPRTIDYNPYFQYNRSVGREPWRQFNYFADAFTLMPYPELGDTLYLKAGDSLVLKPNTPDADLYWYDALGGNSRTIYCPGTYWVKSSSEFSSITDSVVVLPATTWPSDTLLCQPNAELHIADKAYNIDWSTGENSPVIKPSTEGPYDVTFTMPGGCAYTLSTRVSFDRVQLRNLKDTIACDSLLLELKDVEGQRYLWSTGAETAILKTKNPGTYRVSVSNNNCLRTDSFSLEIDSIVTLNTTDSTLCIGDYFEFQPNLPFDWNWVSEPAVSFTDSADIIINWQQPACGLQEDTFLLRFKACDCEAFVPNAFSPDHNGRNDTFLPILRCEPLSYQFAIYNRWGQLLFTSSDPQLGWTPEGLPIGAYYYTLRYQGSENRKWYSQHGFVHAVK